MNAKTKLSLAKELLSRKEVDKAIESYREIIQHDDKNIAAFIGLGKLYLEKEMWEESLYYFLRAEVVQPSQEVYHNIGNLFFKKQNFKKAVEFYEKAENLGRPVYEIYFNKGFCLEKLKFKKESVLSFIKAFKLNPSQEELAFKIAPRALEAKLFREAIEFYQIILKYQELPLYYAEMGLAYMELAQYEESKRCYQKAKELTLKTKKDFKMKEMTYEDFVAKYPKIDQQIEEIEELIQNGQSEYRHHLELGNMLFIKGEYQKSLDSYLKARDGYLYQMMLRM